MKNKHIPPEILAQTIVDLTLYAKGLFLRFRIRPSLLDPEDVALEAILRLYDPVKYLWNPRKLSLRQFLNLQVRHIVIDLVRSSHHGLERICPDPPECRSDPDSNLLLLQLEQSLANDLQALKVCRKILDGCSDKDIQASLTITRRSLSKVKARIAAAWPKDDDQEDSL